MNYYIKVEYCLAQGGILNTIIVTVGDVVIKKTLRMLNFTESRFYSLTCILSLKLPSFIFFYIICFR